MATAINIAQTSTAGKKLSKAIADINPNVSNGVLHTFASRLNALTTSDLGTVTKVEKTEIASTYSDLNLTAQKNNDSGNAITISGNNITVDTTKLANTSDLESMSYIALGVTLNNVGIDIGQYIVEGSGDFYEDGYFMTSAASLNSNQGLNVIFFKPSSSTTGTATITIPEGTANALDYNAFKVNFTFV